MARHLFYKVVLIALLCVIYSFLYLNSGVVSEENIDTLRQGERYSGIVCPSSETVSDVSVLLLSEPNKKILNKLEKSNALFYSRESGSIKAIDALDEMDVSILSDLTTLGFVKESDAGALKSFAAKKFKWCKKNATDIGLTEYYWGTKGTAVLHHWSYLYDGALGLGGHAQYGYFVPTVARFVNTCENLEGPYYFIRTAFLIFFLIAIAYIFLLFHIFPGQESIVSIFLAIKIYLFSSIGLFSLLLAPGYEWTREFVFVLFALLLMRQEDSSRNILIDFGIFLFAYLLDPTIASVAAFAIIVVHVKFERKTVKNLIKNGYFQLLAPVVVIGAYFLIASKLGYVVDSFMFFIDFVNLRSGYSLLLMGLAAPMFYVLIGRSFMVTRLNCYFALVGLFCLAYYFITPDKQHFYKTLEYFIPFYLGLIYSFRFKGAGFLFSMMILAFFSSFSIYSLLSTPKAFYFRVWDSWGKYFTARNNSYINKRLLVGYMDGVVYEKLREFPVLYDNGFLIFSSYDKHLLMLFDTRNGFGSPDIVATLNSYSRLDDLKHKVYGSKVVLDRDLFNVETRSGLKRDNPYGVISSIPSHWRLKNLLYAREFAVYIAKNCSKTKTETYWERYDCAGGVK